LLVLVFVTQPSCGAAGPLEEEVEMGGSDAAEEGLRLLASARSAIELSLPPVVHLSGFVGPVVGFVLVRCVSRISAIELLLEDRLTDEATIILRPLVNDGMRLRYLERHVDTRAANVLWWWNEQLSEMVKLSEAAKRSDHPGGPEIAEWVAAERRRIEQVRGELGVRRLLPLPREGRSIAIALQSPGEEFDYLLSTNPSHTTLGSVFAFTSLHFDGSTELHVRDPDPEDAAAVAERASSHGLTGAAAALRMLGWPGAEALEDLRSHQRSQFWDLLGHIWD
jgi:hypothetical protein